MKRKSLRKKLRTGFTTGACAAAATGAAVRTLINGKKIRSIKIPLPDKNITSHRFKVEVCRINKKNVLCGVRKDAGDDPDCTDKALICSSVRWNNKGGTIIKGGRGVGVVTKPGLGLDVGSPAINPVPKKMILQTAEKELSTQKNHRGIDITISVPGGEKIAKKTLNARLGIIGGISILGRTGIVKPYSTAAYRSAVLQAIDVAYAQGNDVLVLTTGRRSETFAEKILKNRSENVPEDAFIQMGDFIGAALKHAAGYSVEKIIICAMIGKLSKIADGKMQTHASGSRINRKFLSGIAKKSGANIDVIKKINTANTSRHISEIIIEHNLNEFFSKLCGTVCEVCGRFINNKMKIETIMTDFKEGVILGHAKN